MPLATACLVKGVPIPLVPIPGGGGPFGPFVPIPSGGGPSVFDCDSCNDRAISGHSAQDLSRRAAAAAANNDCVCAWALVNATTMKDPAARDAVVHEPEVSGCLPDVPTERSALIADAARDGTIKRCLAVVQPDAGEGGPVAALGDPTDDPWKASGYWCSRDGACVAERERCTDGCVATPSVWCAVYHDGGERFVCGTTRTVCLVRRDRVRGFDRGECIEQHARLGGVE